MPGPAYRIETPRLVVRCWDPEDAPLLQSAVEASVEHLRPWMPWAREEPKPLDQRIDLLRQFRGKFDLGQDFVYGIFDPDESCVLGGTGLHRRVEAGGLEIGYWAHVDHVGKGLITEAVAALTRVAFEIEGVGRVVIRCDPENVRSAAIPRRLGFTHEATLRGVLEGGDGTPRDGMVWTLLRADFPTSIAAGAELTAFDAAGDRLL
jgi:RimJ/RimL family protein N-acetyltransferase